MLLEIPQNNEYVSKNKYFTGKTTIEIGDIFEGFKSDKEVAQFANNLAELFDYNLQLQGVKTKLAINTDLARLLINDHPRYFTGEIRDRSVMIIPPDISYASNKSLIDESRVVSFIALRNIYSREKGLLGAWQRESTLYTTGGTINTNNPQGLTRIVLISRSLNGEQMNKLWMDSILGSRKNAARLKRFALTYAYSGGLPELGKR